MVVSCTYFHFHFNRTLGIFLKLGINHICNFMWHSDLDYPTSICSSMPCCNRNIVTVNHHLMIQWNSQTFITCGNCIYLWATSDPSAVKIINTANLGQEWHALFVTYIAAALLWFSHRFNRLILFSVTIFYYSINLCQDFYKCQIQTHPICRHNDSNPTSSC